MAVFFRSSTPVAVSAWSVSYDTDVVTLAATSVDTFTTVTDRGAEDVDDRFMREALAQACVARDSSEVPVGAVVVLGDRVVGRGHNRPIGTIDPTAHAEVEAIRDAARVVGNYRLTGATLYVTLEPCAMCAGAIVHARIGRLVFGATEPKAGAVRSTMRMLEHLSFNHRVEVVTNVLEGECRDLIQSFFAERRSVAQAPPPALPR